MALSKVFQFIKCLNPIYSYREITRLETQCELQDNRHLRVLKAFLEETEARKRFQRELDRAQKMVLQLDKDLVNIRG